VQRRALTLLLAVVVSACSSKQEERPKPTTGSAVAAAGSDAPGTPGTPGTGVAAPAPAPAGGAPAGGAPAQAPAAVPAKAVPGSLPEYGTGPDGRPYYYERALTAEDLQGRTLRDLALMRNTIYARAGNPFRKAWLRDYFTAQPWYKPLQASDQSKLTATDRANAKLVSDKEAGFTREQLVAMKDAITAKSSRTPVDEIELEQLSTRLGTWVASSATPAAKRSPLEDPQQLDRLLTLDQLSDLSRRDLRILRNTVYARRGRPFKSDVLQEWFDGMDWYRAEDSYTDARLTAVDKKNIKLIRSVEDQLGGPLTEYAHKEEEGWFAGA
jgi:YARHG domain